MATSGPDRPVAGEFNPYMVDYIDLVTDGDLLAQLSQNSAETVRILRSIPEDTLAQRPAPGEWSPLEIALHIADTERVMAYRLFWIARGSDAPLPGFDQDAFADVAQGNRLTIEQVVAQLYSTRAATTSLVRTLDSEDWQRVGIVSGHSTSARAMAYVILGHELFHQPDLRKAVDQ